MSQWTCTSVTHSIRDRNDVFGNYLAVTFKLKYSPSRFGSFKEMPRLEWKETITMIERNKGTWWQYIGDQYARNPNSQTFKSWTGRYTNAYYCIRNQLYGPDDTVRLYDKHGNKLPRETFTRQNSDKDKADVIRSYLQSHGGIMDVTVVDKPGINKPKNDPAVHKERILTFDCGLNGAGARVKAYQHLIVNGGTLENQWKRECVISMMTNPFQTAGLRKEPPPPDVTVIKPFTGNAQYGSYI